LTGLGHGCLGRGDVVSLNDAASHQM
jgi:hypothetical protein